MRQYTWPTAETYKHFFYMYVPFCVIFPIYPVYYAFLQLCLIQKHFKSYSIFYSNFQCATNCSSALYVKVKSGKIAILQNIFLNKATSDCLVNLSRLFTILSILNNNIVDMSYNFLCHGNHLVRIYVLP